jgi:hypothetical protein
MSTFLISSVTTFLLFQLLYMTYTTQIGQVVTVTFGNFVAIVLSRITAVVAIVGLLIVALLILFVLLGVGDRHPYPGSAIKISSFVSSPSAAELFYGFILGAVLAAFVNRLLARPPLAPFETRDKADLIIIGVFLFLGLGGGDIFRALAGKLDKVSVGAVGVSVEASLGGAKAPDSPALANKPIAGTQESMYLSSNGSSALAYLSHLEDIIERDTEYLYLFQGDAPLDSQAKNMLGHLRDAKELARITISPPMICLNAWNERTADAGIPQEHLNSFARNFKRIGGRHPKINNRQIAAEFLRIFAAISIDVSSTADSFVVEACKPLLSNFLLFNRFCKSQDNDTSLKDVQLNALECSAERLDYSIYDPLLDEIATGLSKFEEGQGAEERPYFAIGLASLMVQLGRYEAGGAILDAWLQQKAKQARDRTMFWKTADEWYVLRVKTMLAAYISEWMEKEKDSTVTALRDYHLKNLAEISTGLSERLTRNEFFVKVLKDNWRNRDPLELPTECGLEGKGSVLYRHLFSSYISMELTRLDDTIAHPSYDIMFAENTTNDLDRLARLDVSCVDWPNSDLSDAFEVKAEILETLARNALAYTKARSSVESKERREARLDFALRAAEVGLDSIAAPAREDQIRRGGKSFIEKIGPSRPIAIQESLRQTLKDANGTVRRERN